MWIFDSMIPAGWHHLWSQCTAIPTPTLWALTALWPQPLVASHSTHGSCLHQGACVPQHHHPDTTKSFSEDRGQVSVGAMTMILGTSSFLNWVKWLASPVWMEVEIAACARITETRSNITQLSSKGHTKFHPSFFEEKLSVVSVLAQNAPICKPDCFTI